MHLHITFSALTEGRVWICQCTNSLFAALQVLGLQDDRGYFPPLRLRARALGCQPELDHLPEQG